MNLEAASQNFETASGLLYTGFNQDGGCFAVGCERGFQIFNSDPLTEKTRKEFEDGGIGIVEMLFRTNYIGLVGSGRHPKYPTNKVMIWDDLKGKPIFELEFRSVVKNIKLRRDIFGGTPKKLFTFDTNFNTKGLIAVSSTTSRAIIAIPSSHKGHVQIIDLSTVDYVNDHTESFYGSTSSVNSLERFGGSPTTSAPSITTIAAHSTTLYCIALNHDGTRLASASEKGTLIRVFDTTSGRVLHELRRGVDRAEIFSIAFNEDTTRLCVSSDKGTVHIFNLVPLEPSTSRPLSVPSSSHKPGFSRLFRAGNRQSSLAFMKDVLPKYFASEWSFARFQVPNETRCICGFPPLLPGSSSVSDSNAVIILCADGGYFKVTFDPRAGGGCTREIFKRFYRP
ncbi:Phosphatidylinositol 3,5-bisphosphate-binding protein [Entomophthora muscae]|uniref:Phosphatidylinositol 3,5-bisphosphate-binding protein n=1 Tax=Entomophthora muscae TaxID=34485 RepID=A0ACC2SB48_9FUNG|nr:Phosphatidylinositol 3,5-bisphosphate-binding protein [Entomophthora muscae]